MLATVGVHPYDPFGGRQLVDGFALAAFLATACLALARHRSTRDPHALLVGTGFAILAAQTAAVRRLLDGVRPSRQPGVGGQPVPLARVASGRGCWPVCASSSPCRGGNAVAGRRSAPWWWPPSPPARSWAAISSSLVARRSFGTVTGAALRTDAPFAHATWLHRLLTICAAGLLLAAWQRERRPAPDPESVHGWLPAAWLVAVGGLVLYLAWPIQFRPLLDPGRRPAAAGRRDRVRGVRRLGWRREPPGCGASPTGRSRSPAAARRSPR